MLDGIDLDVPAGTVFSQLGPNGAGKTTTVNVLTTLIKADGGTVRVAGHDVAIEARAVRAVIGVTRQFAAVDDLLTGQENLQLMADLHHLRAGEGKRVVTSLLERFDLVESSQKMAATYSGGMRRKLDLAPAGRRGATGESLRAASPEPTSANGLVVVRVDAALRSYPAKLFAVSATNKASTISLTTQELLFIQSLTLGMAFSAFLPKSRIVSAGSATRSRVNKTKPKMCHQGSPWVEA